MIRFACSSCEQNLTASGEGAGRTIRCPRCGTQLEVPVVYQGGTPPVRSFPVVRPERPIVTEEPYEPSVLVPPAWESPERPSKAGPLVVSLGIVAGLCVVLLVMVGARTKGPDKALAAGQSDPQVPPVRPAVAPSAPSRTGDARQRP